MLQGQSAFVSRPVNKEEQNVFEVSWVSIVNMSILNIAEKVLVDNSIVGNQLHTHQPYTNRFDNDDEIRIPIPEDMSTLPGLSHLYIEGKLQKVGGGVTTAKFINNGVAYLFSEIRYEINGVVVDSVTKPGITSTMKGYVSYTTNDVKKLQNAGWLPTNTDSIVDARGNFNVCIPLRMLLGFAEDYGKVLLNIRQELVLIRSNTDVDAVISTTRDETAKVTIDKLYWRVPHIAPGLAQELALTKYIDRNLDTQVAFRSWQLHVIPGITPVTHHSHAIATSTKLQTPRYVITGFQTDRAGQLGKNMSQFDNCGITNLRVFLNTERFPYDNMNINFDNNHYATLYEMYSTFQSSYYNKEDEPLLTRLQYSTTAPLIVVDCSKQKEYLQANAVVFRIEFETSENVAPNTTAYCLVLHDRVFSYNALTKAVKQL